MALGNTFCTRVFPVDRLSVGQHIQNSLCDASVVEEAQQASAIRYGKERLLRGRLGRSAVSAQEKPQEYGDGGDEGTDGVEKRIPGRGGTA